MISALQRLTTPDEIVRILTRLDDADRESIRIRCPRCEWQPRTFDRWCCVDQDHPEHFHEGCGTIWNTFQTHGCCPGCGHQWPWTSCLMCHVWSLHEDWYVKDSPVVS